MGYNNNVVIYNNFNNCNDITRVKSYNNDVVAPVLD